MFRPFDTLGCNADGSVPTSSRRTGIDVDRRNTCFVSEMAQVLALGQQGTMTTKAGDEYTLMFGTPKKDE